MGIGAGMMRIQPLRYGTKVAPKASALFLNGANYLRSPSASLLSGGQITIDVRCRIGTPAPPNGWCLFGQGGSSPSSDQEFGIHPTKRTLYYVKQFNAGIPTLAESSETIPVDTWTLVSLEITGSNVYLYINGVLAVSQAYAQTWSNTGQPLYIGHETVPGYPGSDRFYRGFMDEIRVTNVARYGGVSFTPPTKRYDSSDPLWPNVISLLHFDSDFTDEKGLVWTPINSPTVIDAPDGWEQ